MRDQDRNTRCVCGTVLKHGTDQETDRKTDREKLQIQGLEWNLDQLCTWLQDLAWYLVRRGRGYTRFCFAAGGEPSSERYFMDEPVVTEACGVASNAEDPWDLPR